MIDHVVLEVADLAASKEFYGAALAPLGYREVMEIPDRVIGYGIEGNPDFFIRTGGARGTVHIAFTSPDQETVESFHAAALGAGGRDNGSPGLRPRYHDNYYAAFVYDPDGNNIEAVCHLPW
jgi:catechol 2,3-dioxygenase-like lactoylglutathione lyase family enzyme